MNFNYHKMEFRGVDDPKENVASKPADDGKGEKLFFGCRNDVEDLEVKNVHAVGKDGGPVTVTKPGDVKNGDLVSLLLAATPPYLYNIPLIPQTFFFSEMLKSFVQAKTDRQNLKAQQTHHKRHRKRSWREMTPPKPTYYESDKPLELTIPKQTEEKGKERPPKRCHIEGTEKRYQSSDFVSSNFTAEKLANSSINNSSLSEGSSLNSELLPPTPPLWYPPLYPPHPPFGIDPLHFFIDLRVSAHVWDRKLAADKVSIEPAPPGSPLNLRSDFKDFRERLEPSLIRNRHKSAFTVPPPRRGRDEMEYSRKRSPYSVHYLMSNLKKIYKPSEAKGDKQDGKKGEKERGEEGEEEEEEDEDDEDEVEEEQDEEDGDAKKCKDLRALIGLELVVDYVKQESDDDDHNENVNVENSP